MQKKTTFDLLDSMHLCLTLAATIRCLTEVTRMCLLPSSNDSILGSEAVNRPILHAESNDSLTLSIFHQ